MLEVIRICTLRSNSYIGSASALPDMENLHGKHLQAREIGTEGALFTLSKHSSSSWQVTMEIARGHSLIEPVSVFHPKPGSRILIVYFRP